MNRSSTTPWNAEEAWQTQNARAWYTQGVHCTQTTAGFVSTDAKESVFNEMESGDPNRGLDKCWIHMETEGDNSRDLSVTEKETRRVLLQSI